MTDSQPHNALGKETSPYLLQHRDNPVHWLPWGGEAFAKAQREDKPILLSIGYAACHWCHVMAHESFEDPETARLLNDQFVSIKVDREERPDVDKIYMDALHAFGEQGGWPLTAFLDNDGTPFWGGTYFPNEPRFGRPSFRQILTEIARIWTSERDKVRTNTTHIREALTRGPAGRQPVALQPTTLQNAGQIILDAIDFTHGGLKGAPKFPQTAIFEFLWRLYRRTNDQRFGTALQSFVTNICQGGIYDHLGGGFARYSVDSRWLVPHFEKMLYDNGQLLRLFSRVAIVRDSALLRDRIEETVAFLLTAMRTPSGAFGASYDADSEGEEGRYYVWSAEDIDHILGPTESDLFKSVYGVTHEGNFEGLNILNRLGSPDRVDPETEARLKRSRAALLARRHERIPPGYDDKVLADWNGLAIAALAEAGMLMDRGDWITAAETAMAAVTSHLWKGHVLRQSWRNGQAKHLATADGYANLIDASLALYEATANPAHVSQASTLADAMIKHHWDEGRGAFAFASAQASHLIARPCYAQDDATPNANATMLANLLKLALVTGQTFYRDKAAKLYDSFSGQAFQNPFAHAAMLNAFDDALHLTQIVLVGPPRTPGMQALRRAALQLTTPAKFVIHADGNTTLPEDHLAAGKTAREGVPTLYLCMGTRCSLPVTDPAQIPDRLAALAAS